jgi:hypothetical protein
MAAAQLDAPVNLPDADTRNAFQTRDGLSLYFASIRSDGLGGRDIYVSHRASTRSPWGPATNLGGNINVSVDNVHGDNHPNVSPDGHWLFFSSVRDGGCGGLDLYASHRANVHDDHAWEPATDLGCTINGPGDERSPAFFRDPRTGTTQLFFAATDRSDSQGEDDIYVSILGPDGNWGAATVVPSLSTPFDENKVGIRGDGLEAVISSNRPVDPGGEEGDDGVWIASRRSTRDPWNPARLVFAGYGLPTISWDGATLFFTGPQTDNPDLAGIFSSRRIHPHESENDLASGPDGS